MVQSSLATVDAWLAGVDPVRAPYLAKVRDMALKHFGVETESMRYGMPTYTRPDATDPAFAFNSQKNYISLYVSPRVNALHAEAMKELDAGKSCIRFRKPETIDMALVDRLLSDTVRLNETNC